MLEVPRMFDMWAWHRGLDRAGTVAKSVLDCDLIVLGKGIGRPRRTLTIPVQDASADASGPKFLK